MDTINRAISILIALTVTACSGGGAPSASETPSSDSAAMSDVAAASPTPAPSESPEQSQPLNPCDVGGFNDLPVATCWAKPNAHAAREAEPTPVRIFYTVPAAGWSAFLGAYSDIGQGEDLQRV